MVVFLLPLMLQSVEWKGYSVSFDPKTFSLTFKFPSGEVLSASTPFEPQLVARVGDKDLSIPLRDARKRSVRKGKVEGRPAIFVELRSFPGLPEAFGVRISIEALKGRGEFRVRLEAREEGATLRLLAYPFPLALPRSERAYAVLPIRQGCLLPGNWPKKVWRRYPLLGAWAGMPWWGGVLREEGPGFVAIVETPHDAELIIDHPQGGPPRVGLRWLHSLGSFRYPRALRFCLFERADYNTLAKRYRRHAMERGLFKPLTVKAQECPNVRRLFDAAVIPILICWNDMRRKPPSRRVTPFSKAAQWVRELKKFGLKNAIIHVDGWGRRGYDNLHPDALPPCPEAGGWEGLSELSRVTEEGGYLFGLHDNYRDFYLDSPAFDWKLATLGEEGKRPHYTAWAGGPQSVLCPHFALNFLKRTISEMEKHGVRLTAYYLDVFSSVPLEECYDPAHPMTREECASLRGRCLKFLHDKGIAVSSEDAADWAIPYLDFVYWVPPPGFGVPVPLFELVYHDAVVVPCSMAVEPESVLRCLLYGQIPLSGPYFSQKEARRDNFLCRVHKEIATAEMVSHKFLSRDRSLQETVFSNGVRIRVDFKAGRCLIVGVEGIEPRWIPVPTGALDIRAEVAEFRHLGGNEFEITFKWLANEALTRDYIAFTHFLHPKSPNPERIAINADHRPPLPTSKWRKGSVVIDGPIRVKIPPKYAEGALEVVIGLYDPETGRRLPLQECDRGRRLFLGRILIDAEGGKVRGLRFVPPGG